MEFKLKQFKKHIEVSRIANIHYFEFTRQYHTFKDNHPFRELIYVDSGLINVESENYSGVLTKNSMIIHKAGETHSLTCVDDNAPSVIIIGFECNCPELDIFSNTPVTLTHDRQKLLTDIIKEGRTVFLPPYDVPNLTDMKKRKDFPFGADQMIKLKLETLFIELIRSTNSTLSTAETVVTNTKINEIYDYINENFREPISLDELCFLYSTNKTTLCSHFKKTYGDTVINYINSLKMREAKRLLREGKYNLTQISSILGFSSIHYFSRLFKLSQGISPSNYIKTIKSRLEV